VADELLPRAFSIRSNVSWIDPVNGWLVVDAASPAKADDVIKLLLKAVDKLPLESPRAALAGGVMTEWLQTDEAPAGFTVDGHRAARHRRARPRCATSSTRWIRKKCAATSPPASSAPAWP
jgi:DNA recombination-dependent growth factor C